MGSIRLKDFFDIDDEEINCPRCTTSKFLTRITYRHYYTYYYCNNCGYKTSLYRSDKKGKRLRS